MPTPSHLKHDLRAPLAAFDQLDGELDRLTPGGKRLFLSARERLRQIVEGLEPAEKAPKSGLAPSPSAWLTHSGRVPVLAFPKNTTQVLLLDDDIGMHTVWEQKLSAAGLKEGPGLRCFARPGDFIDAVSDQSPEDLFFIMDQDLAGHSVTGLELIASLGLSARAVLATSRFDDPVVQARAAQLGVPILPKASLHELVIRHL